MQLRVFLVLGSTRHVKTLFSFSSRLTSVRLTQEIPKLTPSSNYLPSAFHVRTFAVSRLVNFPAAFDTENLSDESDEMSANRFSGDYARLGTSSCKKCKQKLDKGSLRLAKVTASPFSEDGDMKLYYHPRCLFETFLRVRATTKVIEEPDDVEGFQDLNDPDQDLINDLIKEFCNKKGSPKKPPQNKSPARAPKATPPNNTAGTSKAPPPSHAAGSSNDAEEKDNSFRQFRKLCADLAEENSYNGKTAIVERFITDGVTGDGFQGDLHLLLKLLLARVIKVVYNLESKQLAKHFSQIFRTNLDEMVEDLEQGDVAETVRVFFEKNRACPPQTKSTLSIQDVDSLLDELSQYTRDDDQQKCLTKIAKRCTSNDLKMIVRLIKHDLRINCGAKHILDALDPNAYEAFKASRNLRDVVDRVTVSREAAGHSGMAKKLSIQANLMTPVQPMLIAEECCLKQHLGDATGFGLKMRHNQKPVDMSHSVQLAGLTNNAKLDLYQRTNQKTATKARIALHMDGVGRFVQEFDSSKTVWEVLESFQSSGHRDIIEFMSSGQKPVVNYMRQEILGECALRSATLRKLGILDGGHLLRLSFRIVNPEALEEVRNKIDKENARHSRLAARANPAETSPQIPSTGDQPSLHALPAESTPRISQADHSEPGFTENLSEEKMDTDIHVTNELLTDQGNAGNLNDQDIQAWSMDTLSEPPVANDNPARQQFPFAEFKFPEETKGMDLYHNELSEVTREDFQPCERESVLYHLRDVEGIEYEAEEDNFFEHTCDDIRKMQFDLSQEASAFSNERPLLTESLRMERQNSNFANYARFILRIQFPGGFVLQGVFRPLETVFALYKYVKESLEDKNLEFELFMSPPKVILDNKTNTLTEAGLSPMTLIYFKSGERNDGFLAREVLDGISSPAEAKQVRDKYMSSAGATHQQQSPSSSGHPSTSSLSTQRQHQNPSSSQPSTSSQTPRSSSRNQDPNATNKVPKWFKPGK